MLPLLLCLLQFSSLPPGAAAPTGVLVQVAEARWGVAFAPPGFEFSAPGRTEDGERAWAAGDGPRGMVANLLIQPAETASSAVECREQSDARAARGSDRHYRFERGRRGALEWTSYIVPDYQGVSIRQRHVHAFLFRDGYCVELELALPRYKSRHQERFDEALDALQIVDAPETAADHDR